VTVHREENVDLRLGVRHKIVQRPFLPGELPEQGCQQATDQSGFPSAILADDGDQARSQGVEIDGDVPRKRFTDSAEP
jgi:hypothetical protein